MCALACGRTGGTRVLVACERTGGTRVLVACGRTGGTRVCSGVWENCGAPGDSVVGHAPDRRNSRGK